MCAAGEGYADDRDQSVERQRGQQTGRVKRGDKPGGKKDTEAEGQSERDSGTPTGMSGKEADPA